MLENVFGRRGEFDVMHFHVDLLHLPLCATWTAPR
jgi:hypothetical protein